MYLNFWLRIVSNFRIPLVSYLTWTYIIIISIDFMHLHSNHSVRFLNIVVFAWQWGPQSILYVSAYCWVLLSWWSGSETEGNILKEDKSTAKPAWCSDGRICNLVGIQVFLYTSCSVACRAMLLSSVESPVCGSSYCQTAGNRCKHSRACCNHCGILGVNCRGNGAWCHGRIVLL